MINGDLTVNTGVMLTDTLPAGVMFSSASAGCTEVGLAVTCDLGSLAFNDPLTVTIVVTPTAVGTITNTVAVAGTAIDTFLGNNVDIENTLILEPQVYLPAILRGFVTAVLEAPSADSDRAP